MKYEYVGEGLGVPGLPHEITDEEAEALGLKELLQEAIRNGSYREAAAEMPAARRYKKPSGEEIASPGQA